MDTSPFWTFQSLPLALEWLLVEDEEVTGSLTTDYTAPKTKSSTLGVFSVLEHFTNFWVAMYR